MLGKKRSKIYDIDWKNFQHILLEMCILMQIWSFYSYKFIVLLIENVITVPTYMVRSVLKLETSSCDEVVLSSVLFSFLNRQNVYEALKTCFTSFLGRNNDPTFLTFSCVKKKKKNWKFISRVLI